MTIIRSIVHAIRLFKLNDISILVGPGTLHGHRAEQILVFYLFESQVVC